MELWQGIAVLNVSYVEMECSLWTPFWNVCHVDMAIGMTPVHLVTLYVRRENVERENLYMSVMMTGKWNYVWSVG